MQLVTAHPDTLGELPPPDLDLAGVTASVGVPGLPFITVDLVRRSDGVWRVAEVGDGEVSDRPSTTADLFMTAILGAVA